MGTYHGCKLMVMISPHRSEEFLENRGGFGDNSELRRQSWEGVRREERVYRVKNFEDAAAQERGRQICKGLFFTRVRASWYPGGSYLRTVKKHTRGRERMIAGTHTGLGRVSN